MKEELFVVLLSLVVGLTSACGGPRDESAAAGPAGASGAAQVVAGNGAVTHLRVEGARFIAADGRPFEWRGISAFRLLEMLAHGREAEAVAYLDWAAAQRLTVVRVFAMAQHLFQLTPAEGLQVLPRLLQLARTRGLHVEVVALVDTAAIALDLEQQASAVGAVAAQHAVALVEIANEPWHPTQDTRLHDPAHVTRLAAQVPAAVPVALGSVEGDAGYAAGAYITWHAPRGSGQQGWQHVMQVAAGAALAEKWRKPFISDEPIGAHVESIPGRRDNVPAHFAAAAALTRLAGLGATFHYERGLQAQIPTGRELDAFTAWRAGLDLLGELPHGGRFLAPGELATVVSTANVAAAFGRLFDREVWIVVIDPAPNTSVVLSGGWTEAGVQHADGVRVVRGRR